MKLDDLALSWNAKESLAGKVALVTDWTHSLEGGLFNYFN